MNLSFITCFVISFIISFYTGSNPPPTVDPVIYNNTATIQTECDKLLFDQTLATYNEFYGHSCKNIKVKLGEVSKIEQQLSSKMKYRNIEVVYNETIKLENKSITLTSDIVELHVYNRKKSSYDKVMPPEITLRSRKAAAVEKHKNNIRLKSEKLFNLLVKEK
jgi:hypothetical protein